MNGAQVVVQMLQEMGVPFLSVLCGNGLDQLLQAADEAGLPIVDTHDEQAASYVADGYARLTGRLGVCAVSSGIAHVNALAGLLNAHFDGAPVLLISGTSRSDTLPRGGFQSVDQVALAEPICKRAELVTRPERLPAALRESVAAALNGRPGPVHLSVSADAFSGEVPDGGMSGNTLPSGRAETRSAGNPGAVRRALELIAAAEAPLIVAGSGVFYAGGGESLERFGRLADVPIVTPIWDRGTVDSSGTTFMGVVGAASGEPRLIEDADLIVMLGAEVDYRVKYLDAPPLRTDRKVIRVDIDPEHLGQGVTAEVAILGDPASVLAEWAVGWENEGYAAHADWLAEASRRHGAFYGRWAEPVDAETGGMSGQSLVQTLGGLLTDETVFLIDGGNIGQWAHMLLCRDRYPGHWLTCGASGVVGWGVPGAMAARLAYPERPVVLLSGDGAIGFGLMEFESAARQGLASVTVLADDRAWGIVASGQEAHGGRRIASDIGPTDYVAVVKALGGRGVQATTEQALSDAIKEGLSAGVPTLVHAPIRHGGPADRG